MSFISSTYLSFLSGKQPTTNLLKEWGWLCSDFWDWISMEGNRRNAGNGNGANRCGDFLMAGIRKRRIVGTKIAASSPAHRRSLLKRLKGSLGYADQRLYTSRQVWIWHILFVQITCHVLFTQHLLIFVVWFCLFQFQEGSNKYEEFFCYNENEEGDEMVGVDGEPKGIYKST